MGSIASSLPNQGVACQPAKKMLWPRRSDRTVPTREGGLGAPPMPSADSVTTWLGQLQAGQLSALTKLHRRYWPFLVALARKQIRGTRLHEADEEDIAQEAFLAFYQTLQRGGAPRLASRQDLLALLSTITGCRAV